MIVVAVACCPYGGSEGKVGWEGVLAISTFAEVYVVTSAKYRHEWDQAALEGRVPGNVTIEFLGTDQDWHSNRLIARGQSWIRYVQFLKEVERVLPRTIKKIQPHLIHQLTYATWRVPSNVWKFGLPSIWGPIGGSGEVPQVFRSGLSKTTRILEFVRGLHSRRILASRKFKRAIQKTSFVITANNETHDLLKPHRLDQPMEVLPVAYLSKEKVLQFRREKINEDIPGRSLQLFAGGNIEGRKGISFALQALGRAKEAGVDFHYTIAGGGPDIGNLKILAADLGIESDVTFHSGFRGQEYIDQLKKTDIFLMPSFRETLGMTCQEAILSGAYPLVADISAQGEMAQTAGIMGASVESEEKLVTELAEQIIGYYQEPENYRNRAMKGSLALGVFFSQKRYIEVLRRAYLEAVGGSEMINRRKHWD